MRNIFHMQIFLENISQSDLGLSMANSKSIFQCLTFTFTFRLTSVHSEACSLPQTKWFILCTVNTSLKTRKHSVSAYRWLSKTTQRRLPKETQPSNQNHPPNHVDEFQTYIFSHSKSKNWLCYTIAWNALSRVILTL